MDNLVAHTQYNDLRGTAAADESDQRGIGTYLRAQGLITEDEYVAAVTFYFGSMKHSQIRVLVTNLEDRKLISEASTRNEKLHPSSLRKIGFTMPIEEFLGFYKRLDVKLIESGLGDALNDINLDALEDS